MYFLVILTTICAPISYGFTCLDPLVSQPMQVETRHECMEIAEDFTEGMLLKDYVNAETGQVVNFAAECRIFGEQAAEEE